MQIVVLFDFEGSVEEPHIILELSASCVRRARLRAPSPRRKRASFRACALARMRVGGTLFCERERVNVRDDVGLCQ